MQGRPADGAGNIVHLPQARAPARVPPVPMVPFERWTELRDRAAAALLGGTRRLVLTGPPGTGKTVLIEHVARVLRAAGRPVEVRLADQDPVPPQTGETLFVDEADRLPAAKRAALAEAPGTLVLVGLPSLRPRPPPDGTLLLEALPLEQDEARAYIAQWLEQTGRTPADLDSKAVRRLVELSGGVPRLMSTLLAASVWLAGSQGATVVAAEHVDEVAAHRGMPVPSAKQPLPAPAPPRRRRVGPWLVMVAVLLAAAVAATLRFPDEVRRGVAALRPPTRVEPAPAPPLPIPVPKPAPDPAPPPVVAQAPAPPAAAGTALSAETIELLLRRGREMRALNDLSAARLLFRRAADGGSAEGALELGKSFDPRQLTRSGDQAQADAAEAARWYALAAERGNAEAARLRNR